MYVCKPSTSGTFLTGDAQENEQLCCQINAGNAMLVALQSVSSSMALQAYLCQQSQDLEELQRQRRDQDEAIARMHIVSPSK